MAGKKRAAPPAWRAALLGGLARGLAVKEAARAAGVGTENAYSTRRRDPGFAADWAAAKAAGAERLRRDGAPVLAPHEVVRASRGGRPRIERAGPGRWSAGREALFLGELAASANVSAAARAAGVSQAAVYKRRRDWPGFAEGWAAALEQGYARIETLLVHAATTTLEPEPPAARDTPAMTVEQAMTLFKMHRHSVTGEGARPRHGWRTAERPIEEVRAEVLRRIEAMERRAGGRALIA